MTKKVEPMLTTTEVMQRLDAPYQTVIAWIKKGLLPGAKHEDTPRGPIWMVPASSVINFEPPKAGRPRKPLAELKGKPRRKD